MKKINTKQLILSALFLALGMVLPLFTSQIKEIGDTLLPMHIPVLFCGFICGWKYGLMVGFLLPLLRAAVFSMPPLYPNAVWMSFELATYGLVSGLLYAKVKQPKTGAVYVCLITAMISGRVIWGIAKTILLGVAGKSFSFQAFITGGVLDAIPGIVLQLILIPSVMGLLRYQKKRSGYDSYSSI